MSEEKPQDYGSQPQDIARRWIEALAISEKSQRDWWKKAESVLKRYRDDRADHDDTRRFNILYSHVETLKPTMVANPPKPIVARRYKDKDPLGRQVSEIIERALEYAIEDEGDYSFMAEVRAGLEDYLLPGRWVDRVHYEAKRGPETQDPIPVQITDTGVFDMQGAQVDPAGVQMGEQGPFVLSEPYRPVLDESARVKHVHYTNFRHAPARKWSEVDWVAFETYMTRGELEERFGKKIGAKVGLDYKPKGLDEDAGDQWKKARVYEIWCKESNQVYWIAKSYPDGPLDVTDPPLDLSGFFPCTVPLIAVQTNDSLTPIPEFTLYQDQADELDLLTARIQTLTKALKVVGWYAGEEDAIPQVFGEGTENKLVPVPTWAMDGKVSDKIDFFPVETVQRVLMGLYDAKERVKHDFFEISGMADVIRGDTNPNETATAQQIKGNFATLRLQDRQRLVQVHIRDMLRLIAEVMADQFDPETLVKMTGQPVSPEIIALLRDDKLRSYRVDVETDSTVYMDEEAEKASRVEFIQAATTYLGNTIPVIQEIPELAQFAGQMLMWGVRSFGQARELERGLEEALDNLAAKPQEPRPDPEMMQLQADMQYKAQELKLREREQALKEWEAQAAAGGEQRKQTLLEYEAAREAQQSEAEAMADYQALSKVVESVVQAVQAMNESTQRMLAVTQKLETSDVANVADNVAQQTTALISFAQSIRDMSETIAAPKRLVRDNVGRPVGVEVVQ